MKLQKEIKNNKNLESFKKIFTKDIDLNYQDEDGYSALHIAIANSALEIAEYLIQNKHPLDLQDNKGQTALHYAALYGYYNLAKLILSHKGNLNIDDNYGNQPLWTAVFNDKGFGQRIEIIELFLQNGADPTHKNKVGKTPYDIAIIANYNRVKEILDKYSVKRRLPD
jgi:ankyrin repeat protein